MCVYIVLIYFFFHFTRFKDSNRRHNLCVFTTGYILSFYRCMLLLHFKFRQLHKSIQMNVHLMVWVCEKNDDSSIINSYSYSGLTHQSFQTILSPSIVRIMNSMRIDSQNKKNYRFQISVFFSIHWNFFFFFLVVT